MRSPRPAIGILASSLLLFALVPPAQGAGETSLDGTGAISHEQCPGVTFALALEGYVQSDGEWRMTFTFASSQPTGCHFFLGGGTRIGEWDPDAGGCIVNGYFDMCLVDPQLAPGQGVQVYTFSSGLFEGPAHVVFDGPV